MGYLTVAQNYDPGENDDNQYDTPNVVKKGKKALCYYSDIVGSSIVDAITGEQYPWRVGSFDEQRFFKVMDTTNTGELSKKGSSGSYYGRNSRKAFYENPHAYMRYKRMELNEDLVKNWYDKVNRLYPGEYILPTGEES